MDRLTAHDSCKAVNAGGLNAKRVVVASSFPVWLRRLVSPSGFAVEL